MELKEIYIKTVEEQLTEWKMEINNLEAKAGKTLAETRIIYLQKVDELKAKQNAA